jgi:hypothetical protein
MKVESLHNTLETFTLGCANDVDPLIFLKKLNAGMVALRELLIAIETKLDHFTLWRAAMCFDMPPGSLIDTTFLLVAVANLNGSVSVFFLSFPLQEYIVTHIDDSHRRGGSILVEDTGHSYFFTNQSDAHCNRPFVKVFGSGSD